MLSSDTNLATSHPDQVLPVEIFQIFQDFAEFRLTELSVSRYDASGSYVRPKSRIWSVSPLLSSCNLFASLMLPELYREVLIVSIEMLFSFFSQPDLESFYLIRKLSIMCEILPQSSVMSVGNIIEERILQTQIREFPGYPETHRQFGSSVEGLRDYQRFWRENLQHNLESIEIQGDNISLLARIAEL